MIAVRSFVNTQEIAQMIRYFRKRSGLSQLQLAQLAGVGKTAVFDAEKGKETLQLDTLLKILSVLNIRLNFTTPIPYATEQAI